MDSNGKFLEKCQWQESLPLDERPERWKGILFGFGNKQELPPVKEFCHTHQVHGTDVRKADWAPSRIVDSGPHLPHCDGLYTEKLHFPLVVKTADCLPVLVYHQAHPFVMALHCGWKGLTSGILRQAMAIARQECSDPMGLQFLLGPCIQREAFEVEEDVVERVFAEDMGLDETQANLALAKGTRKGKWHLDLQVTAALALKNEGVSGDNLCIFRICTFTNNLFHSHRRDKDQAGRNLSWIGLGT